MIFKQRPSAEVSIKKFSANGNGLGTYAIQPEMERNIEVPFTMPGDLVEATVLKKRKSCHQGSLEKILTPSPNRHPPRCQHFGSCGGCRWQHVDYSQQLQWKEQFVQNCFKDFDVAIKPIIPSEKEWEYRNKMEFSFSQDSKGERFLGLMKDQGRGRVLNLTECHLVHRWFTNVLEGVRNWWTHSNLQAYHPFKDQGSLRTLIIREGTQSGDKLVMLTVSGNPDYALNKEHIHSFVKAIQSSVDNNENQGTLSIFLRIQQIRKGAPTQFYEMLLEGSDCIRETLHVQSAPNAPPTTLEFHVSPTAFFQPNTKQAEKFYSLALQMSGINKGSIVYDLYCGTGTIGLSIAKQAKQVIGIELSEEAALDARENAKRNHIKNYTVLCGDVGQLLKGVLQETTYPSPDVLFLDPPRAGLNPEALSHVIALKAPKIVYISCNPKTQAENIAALKAAGYALTAVQPVDQFPHTVHVENIAILSK